MIDPVGDNVLKHEEKYFSTIRIPYKYDKLAKCDLWIKSLNEIFENNQIKIGILQEYFGYYLGGLLQEWRIEGSNNEQKVTCWMPLPNKP